MDPYDLADDLDAFAAETPEWWQLSEEHDVESVELPDDMTELRDLANKLLRKSARLDRDRQQIVDVASRELARIAAWQGDRVAGVDAEQERVTSLLDRLMRSYRQASGGKTLKLPNGELRLRQPKERVVLDDEASFVSWAKTHPLHELLLREKTEAVKAAIAAGCKPDDDGVARFARELSAEPLPGLQRWKLYDTTSGERVPGVVVERDEEPTFSLSTDRGADE